MFLSSRQWGHSHIGNRPSLRPSSMLSSNMSVVIDLSEGSGTAHHQSRGPLRSYLPRASSDEASPTQSLGIAQVQLLTLQSSVTLQLRLAPCQLYVALDNLTAPELMLLTKPDPMCLTCRCICLRQPYFGAHTAPASGSSMHSLEHHSQRR